MAIIFDDQEEKEGELMLFKGNVPLYFIFNNEDKASHGHR